MEPKEGIKTKGLTLVFLTVILAAMAASFPWLGFAAIPPQVSITSPAAGAYVNTGSILVSGTADVNTTIELFIDGNTAGTTVCDGQGSWSLEIIGLPGGSHSVYARATDAETNVGISNTVTFQVDLTAPAISITSPLNGTWTNQPVIEGQAEPGTEVTVYVYGKEATVSADVYGYWCYTDNTLPEGSLSVYAVAVDKAGNQRTSEVCNFVLDMTRPRVLTDIYPAEWMTQVPLTTEIRVYLMDASPLNQLTLTKGISLSVMNDVYDAVGETVNGTVYNEVYSGYMGENGEAGTELIFKPDEPLLPSTRYMVSVNPEIADVAGNPVYPRFWTFTTMGGLNTENPHGNYMDNVNVCANCHTPHRATSPELVQPRDEVTATIDDYCNACHDGTSAPMSENWQMTYRHDYKVSREGTLSPSACTACHDPHLKWSQINPNLLQDFYYYQHNDPTNPYLPSSSEQALCEECHDSTITDDSRVAYEQYHYKGWQTASGSINDLSLCLRCHDGNAASDIATYYKSPSRHTLLAKDGSSLNGGIPCSECHDTHGSNNLMLIRDQLGHKNARPFKTTGSVWDPPTERSFCQSCHNNSTELFGIVACYVYSIPGHEEGNVQACSVCHGGSPQTAAHGPQ